MDLVLLNLLTFQHYLFRFCLADSEKNKQKTAVHANKFRLVRHVCLKNAT